MVTTAPINHTKPSPHSPSAKYYSCRILPSWHEHTVCQQLANDPGDIRTCNLKVTSPILYHQTKLLLFYYQKCNQGQVTYLHLVLLFLQRVVRLGVRVFCSRVSVFLRPFSSNILCANTTMLLLICYILYIYCVASKKQKKSFPTTKPQDSVISVSFTVSQTPAYTTSPQTVR